MSYPPPLEASLLTAINDGNIGDDDFNLLTMSVFSYQFQHNSSYQNYCTALKKSPKNITHWSDIPAVPTDIFKQHNLPTRSFPSEKTRHTFTTSGTTNEIKGQHHLPSLTLYQQSIVSAWNQLNLPRPARAIFLTPTPEHAPQSSLSHMMGTLSRNFAEESIWAIDPDGKMNTDLVFKTLEKQKPIALLGTALSFLHLLEELESPLRLPKESWIMETGGYKGSGRQLEKTDLYALFEKKLGLKPESIINEYSMTELSSQFYTTGLGKPHSGPSWTRTRVIDPRTETDALPGQPGHLVIYDLANLHSIMAIRTQDLAISNHPDMLDKTNSFTLLGRDPSALPRGCSRAADHTLRFS